MHPGNTVAECQNEREGSEQCAIVCMCGLL